MAPPVSVRRFGVLPLRPAVQGSQPFMHRRALFLDAMGTLLSLEAPVARLVRLLRGEFGADVTEAQAGAALGAEISHYRTHMGEARDEPSLRTLRRRCAAVLWDALPSLPELAGADEATMTRVLLATLHFTAFPDACRLLERARAAGARVIVVSNWDVSLTEVLERAGLARSLDGVVVSAVVGAAKPSPLIFGAALELAGTGAADCVHVGDSLEEDVIGARAAGIDAVLLDRARRSTAPGWVPVIASLDELSL